MSLAKTLTRPVGTLADAVFMPFKAMFVVGLCWGINAMTFHGVWWVKWVALGMSIATVVAVARGIKTLLVLGLAGWVGMKIYRRWGPEAKQRFDDWMADFRSGTQPKNGTESESAYPVTALGSPATAADALRH